MKITPNIFVFLLSLLASQLVFAGSATWKLNPPSDVWLSPGNWTPATVPNGPSDTATFGTSNQTSVVITTQINQKVELSGIQFNPGASAFTITLSGGFTVMDITGIGIVNNSGVMQNLTTDNCGYPQFHQNATIGDLVTITNPESNGCSWTYFLDTSSAGAATIINVGSPTWDDIAGSTNFFGSSTAGNATILNDGTAAVGPGGWTGFYETSSAGTATINNMGVTSGSGGGTFFDQGSTADHATFINSDGGGVAFERHSRAGYATFTNNPVSPGATGCTIIFSTSSSADHSTLINNGGDGAGAAGGYIYFWGESHADDATIVAHGGVNGGNGAMVVFDNNSTGDQARIDVLGNGQLDISKHAVPGIEIGSLEGDGSVLLGANHLTIGANNLSTTFKGVISGTGSVSKVGRGQLVLENANTYTRGTTLERGSLVLQNSTGSATGSGAVTVNGGALSGLGSVAGTVTIGSGVGKGASLAPGGKGNGALHIGGSLTLNADATCQWLLNSNRQSATQASANGITLNAAQFASADLGNGALAPGTVFTVINNTAATPIAGTFVNLSDGSAVTVGNNTFQANYEGGDGNDLTLTVVP